MLAQNRCGREGQLEAKERPAISSILFRKTVSRNAINPWNSPYSGICDTVTDADCPVQKEFDEFLTKQAKCGTEQSQRSLPGHRTRIPLASSALSWIKLCLQIFNFNVIAKTLALPTGLLAPVVAFAADDAITTPAAMLFRLFGVSKRPRQITRGMGRV